MAHWAKIDENNIVERVLVTSNDDPAGDEGYSWLVQNLGGTWIQTSYNGNIRARFAGIGYSYDPDRDVFIAPSPFPSWVLNEETTEWEAPIPQPTDFDGYWDEDSQAWVALPETGEPSA